MRMPSRIPPQARVKEELRPCDPAQMQPLCGAALETAPPLCQLDLTSIFLTDSCTFALLGISTVRTPCLNVAWMPDDSTP